MPEETQGDGPGAHPHETDTLPLDVAKLWAKSGARGRHPLICHKIDTANVVAQPWSGLRRNRARRRRA